MGKRQLEAGSWRLEAGQALVAAFGRRTAGTGVARQSYFAYGQTRVDGNLPTDFSFTGQRGHELTGLIYYNARWYNPYINRWIQPDSIVPDLYNPQDLNRYSYVRNNPTRYTDSSGHCIDGLTTIACIAIGVGIALKVVDYAWTAYDVYQSGRVLADSNAAGSAKVMAGLNLALAVVFEAGEPDDFLPAGLPLDDVARRAVMNGAQEAYEAGGQEALEKFLREQLGEHTDEVFQKLGLGRAFDPKDISHVFDNPRHGLVLQR